MTCTRTQTKAEAHTSLQAPRKGTPSLANASGTMCCGRKRDRNTRVTQTHRHIITHTLYIDVYHEAHVCTTAHIHSYICACAFAHRRRNAPMHACTTMRSMHEVVCPNQPLRARRTDRAEGRQGCCQATSDRPGYFLGDGGGGRRKPASRRQEGEGRDERRRASERGDPEGKTRNPEKPKPNTPNDDDGSNHRCKRRRARRGKGKKPTQLAAPAAVQRWGCRWAVARRTIKRVVPTCAHHRCPHAHDFPSQCPAASHERRR